MRYEIRGKRCKKPGITVLIVTFLSFLIINFSLSTFNFSLLHAANPKKQLSEIEQKLKMKKQQVQEAIEKEKSILTEVDRINRGIKQKQGELKDYVSRISQTQSNIKNLEDEIITLAGKLEQNRQNLKTRLRTLYKQQHGAKALILITARDYQDLVNKSRHMSLLAFQDSRMMETFNNEIAKANEKKKELELMKQNLQVSKDDAQKKQEELSADLRKKDELLGSVREKRSSYEKMIRELEESSEKLREMIESFEKEEPSIAVKGTGFNALRGHLPWPVEGEVIVPFGKYNDPQYNIPVFKNGIEIKSKEGEEPEAVSGGNVVYADWFKGYGLLLIINHGSGYHSLYGHLSEIFHKPGDIIKKGTAVGKIGESGLLNVPSLYFEIRYKGKPVDPMQWLKKANIKNRR